MGWASNWRSRLRSSDRDPELKRARSRATLAETCQGQFREIEVYVPTHKFKARVR